METDENMVKPEKRAVRSDGEEKMHEEMKCVGRRQLVDMHQIDCQLHRIFDKQSKDDSCRYEDIKLIEQKSYGL